MADLLGNIEFSTAKESELLGKIAYLEDLVRALQRGYEDRGELLKEVRAFSAYPLPRRVIDRIDEMIGDGQPD